MGTGRRIGVIGIGNMGTALIAGLLKTGQISKEEVCASDISAQRRYQVSRTYGVKCFSDNRMVVTRSDILIIAVEPKHVKSVLEDIREALTGQLLISIAAGTPIEFLKQTLRKEIPIVRAMPNNPCLVGEGMTVITSTTEVTNEKLKVAEGIFSSVGKVLVLDEHFFNAVTGLSGSGPAYIYLVIEGLVEGGVKSGLPEDTALTLAVQTVVGAGKMVFETQINPSKLRQMVTTPGGTTVEGLKELERGNVKTFFSTAVEKAAQRSQELTRT
ncbi:MAG: pyrroline-5-carboxylate reductase [Candidatus Bathyarchaeota archaeon]